MDSFELRTAMHAGDISVVQNILATNDMAEAHSDGFTSPLHLAAASGLLSMVKLVLATPGVPTNPRDCDGRTPLYAAATTGWLDIVENLLSRSDIDANSAGDDGWSALHACAAKGHTPVCALLLQTPGINCNSVAYLEKQPMLNPLFRGYTPRIDRSLPKRTYVDTMTIGWTPLHAAVYNGHLGIVQQLFRCPDIDRVPRVRSSGGRPVHLAVEQDGHAVLICLIELEIDCLIQQD